MVKIGIAHNRDYFNRDSEIVDYLLGRNGKERKTVRQVGKIFEISFQRVSEIYKEYKKKHEPTLPNLRLVWAMSEEGGDK